LGFLVEKWGVLQSATEEKITQ